MLKTPWILYCLSIIFTGLLQMRLQSYITNPAHGITRPAHLQHPDLELLRPMIVVAICLVSIGVMLLGYYWWARYVLVIISPLMALYGRRHRRLLALHEARS